MALVLTRGPGEVICIGEDVIVTVISVQGNQVKLAVSAPRELRVDRLEVRASKDS